MKKLQLLLFALFVVNGITAQENTPKIRLSEFHFQNGIVFNSNQRFGVMDFKRLAPNSELLAQDLSSFYGNNDFFDNFPNSSNYTSIQLGLTFHSKPNPLWRIGISHVVLGDISKDFSRYTTLPYDTLTSSQTGEQYFLDSIYDEGLSMRYSAQQLRLETSLIFRTDPLKRWSLYAGVGMTFGISYMATTTIDYRISSSLSSSNFQSYYSTNDYQEKQEYFMNETNWSSSFFIPMGVDFCLGKKREFWKRMHVYYEMKPSITYTSIPELKRITNVNMINSFGLKVSF